MSTFEKLQQCICDAIGADSSNVTPKARLVADLGADSLDTVEIIMAVEEAFGIEVDDEVYWRLADEDAPVSEIQKAIESAIADRELQGVEG